MSKTINVDDLTRVSKQYDPILRMLPFKNLASRVAEMGFRFISSDKELREVSFERKQGISKPLAAGVATPDYTSEIGKTKEAVLDPEWGYTAIKEDIMNYEDVNVISNAPEDVNPETKRHPQELLIIEAAVKTVNEDILDAIYPASRDEDDASPLGLFNGIDSKLDVLVAAGDISTANGNLYETGTIAAPDDDTDTEAYEQIVAFLRTASWGLKQGGAILKMTQVTYYRVMDALANKLKYKGVMAYDMLVNALQGDAAFAGLSISVEPEMGTGDRLILTKAQNLDFSLWTNAAVNFVQVRTPYENPNLVQFWSQYKAGTRVRSHNKKMLLINDGTPVAQALSGDYS